MKDILLKRNELKNKSVYMRSMKFDPELNEREVESVTKQQHDIYNKWNFYDKFIKAREEVKNEVKFDNMGKAK